jgi:hypothetical protein
LFKLLRLFLRVTVANDQEINLCLRIAGLLNRDERCRRDRLRSIYKLIRWIDRCGPDVLKGVLRIAFLQRDSDGRSWFGKTQRLLKRALDRLRFVRCFPLAIDRSKAT